MWMLSAFSACLLDGDAWRARRAVLVCAERVVDVDGDGVFALAAEGEGGGCAEPAPLDCDDTDDRVAPGAPEIPCNTVDDDCDPATPDVAAEEVPGDAVDGDCDLLELCYLDADGDGFGAGTAPSPDVTCSTPGLTRRDGDCADADADVAPGAAEICNTRDDDCDGLVDDADDSIDRSELTEFPVDADGDGYGDPENVVTACFGEATFPEPDCDDTDPLANVDQGWSPDTDGDGAGAGEVALVQCLNPGQGFGPEGAGVDCAPDDPSVSPLAVELCSDEQDQDCDFLVACDDPDCGADEACRAVCSDAEWAPRALPDTYFGDTTAMGNDELPPCAYPPGGFDVALWFVPPVTGTIVLSTEGTAFDTMLFALEYCDGPALDCNDDAGVPAYYPYGYPIFGTTYTYGTLTSEIVVDVVAGEGFLVVVDGFTLPDRGPFVLTATVDGP
jgi:hypothetical protein